MKPGTAICVILGAAFMPACDQVKITAQWDPPTSLLQDESPAGIYRGTLTDTSGAVPRSEPVTAVIDADGNIQIIFTADTERHVAGRIDVDGDRLTGTLTEYSGSFASFTGIGGVSEITLRGNISAGAAITGFYTAGTHAGQFALDYQAGSDTASSLALLTGIWSFSTATAGGVTYATTWEIDENGGVFGTDTVGCVFFGEVRVPDSRVNIYDFDLQVSSCGYLNGMYSGSGFRRPAAAPDFDQLTVAITNDVYAFSAILQ